MVKAEVLVFQTVYDREEGTRLIQLISFWPQNPMPCAWQQKDLILEMHLIKPDKFSPWPNKPNKAPVQVVLAQPPTVAGKVLL